MHPILPATTTTTAVIDAEATSLTQALAALDDVPSLNLVAMPALATMSGDGYEQAIAAISTYCAQRRAFFIVDPPAAWTSVDAVVKGVDGVASIVKENGATYWPLLTSGSASAAIASVYAATDNARGVWKAPAGITAVLPDAHPAYKLTHAENGILNPLGVNCIRTFPVYGTVVWGARTLAGADVLQSDWKYVNARRLALFIESSIIDGLQWTAAEPNAEPLWSEIRLSVTAFLRDLWTAGAVPGITPAQAFFVECDATTTTQSDIDNGRLNVVVGFAPTTPAEFVILQIAVSAVPTPPTPPRPWQR